MRSSLNMCIFTGRASCHIIIIINTCDCSSVICVLISFTVISVYVYCSLVSLKLDVSLDHFNALLVTNLLVTLTKSGPTVALLRGLILAAMCLIIYLRTSVHTACVFAP